MNEIDHKYQIGVRRFKINWVGIYSLYCKETLRFLSVFGQTIIGPIITAILFLVVISLSIGDNRENVLKKSMMCSIYYVLDTFTEIFSSELNDVQNVFLKQNVAPEV